MKTHPLLMLAVSATAAAADPVTFSSGTAQTTLVELYTSEGCSSCPPAERRMNTLADHDGLWSQFVPVAFHVDYWNHLGWKDRFSRPDYSRRQRAYSKEWRSHTVYTPCFVENGKPTRSPNLSTGSAQPGKLQATLEDGQVTVRFSPGKMRTKKLSAWVAPLSGKESTHVKSGENRGHKLEHCFVALDLESIAMKKEGELFTATLPFDQSGKPKAISVWISRIGSLEPIQATGGWLE